MNFVDDPAWRQRFILTAFALTSAERNALARAASAGSLVRVTRGAYIHPIEPAEQPLPREQQSQQAGPAMDRAAIYRDLVLARHLVASAPLVFSHASAAALWRLPRVGHWPERVHTISAGSSGRRTANVLRHVTDQQAAPDAIDGVALTSLIRTVVDLARTESATTAVVAADAAMSGVRIGDLNVAVSREQLLDQLNLVGSGRGVRGARFAIEFADAKSASPGETLSRLSIARAGLSQPVLQQRFEDEQGLMFSDFWWPDVRVAGEFDGVGKYLRSEWTGGRSAAEVVIDEKRREDRLRRQVGAVVRWGWDVALSPSRLGALLRAAGVR